MQRKSSYEKFDELEMKNYLFSLSDELLKDLKADVKFIDEATATGIKWRSEIACTMSIEIDNAMETLTLKISNAIMKLKYNQDFLHFGLKQIVERIRGFTSNMLVTPSYFQSSKIIQTKLVHYMSQVLVQAALINDLIMTYSEECSNSIRKELVKIQDDFVRICDIAKYHCSMLPPENVLYLLSTRNLFQSIEIKSSFSENFKIRMVFESTYDFIDSTRESMDRLRRSAYGYRKTVRELLVYCMESNFIRLTKFECEIQEVENQDAPQQFEDIYINVINKFNSFIEDFYKNYKWIRIGVYCNEYFQTSKDFYNSDKNEGRTSSDPEEFGQKEDQDENKDGDIEVAEEASEYMLSIESKGDDKESEAKREEFEERFAELEKQILFMLTDEVIPKNRLEQLKSDIHMLVKPPSVSRDDSDDDILLFTRKSSHVFDVADVEDRKFLKVFINSQKQDLSASDLASLDSFHFSNLSERLILDDISIRYRFLRRLKALSTNEVNIG